jgi:uncharacterized protein (DUF1697 family)
VHSAAPRSQRRPSQANCARPDTGKLALTIQSAIEDTHGFFAPVMVITAADLAAIVRENPLLNVAVDPARHLVAFVAHARELQLHAASNVSS